MVTTERPTTQRLFGLDVLRGVALVLVLLRHVPIEPNKQGPLPEQVLYVGHTVGWSGVDLFFVLSGFLISTLLFREVQATGTIRIARFLARRCFKIYPSYYIAYGGLTAAQVVAFTMAHSGDNATRVVRNALPNLVFIQNFSNTESQWPHSWSVAIEEHFYLALPLLLLAGLMFAGSEKSQFRWLVPAVTAVCVTSLVFRLIWAARDGATWDELYYPTPFRADTLSFGVLLGYLNVYRHAEFIEYATRYRRLLLLSILPVLTITVIWPVEGLVTCTVGFTLLYLAYGGLVAVATASPDLGLRGPLRIATRALSWLGIYSYTIYLAHSVVYTIPGSATVRRWMLEHTISTPWTDRLLFWVISIVVGVALSHSVERPFLRLRSRVVRFPEQSGPPLVQRREPPIPVRSIP